MMHMIVTSRWKRVVQYINFDYFLNFSSVTRLWCWTYDRKIQKIFNIQMNCTVHVKILLYIVSIGSIWMVSCFYREHSRCLPNWVHSQCKDPMCWPPSEECNSFGMWCIWCTSTCEQAEPGTDHVPFHQRLHSPGIWRYLLYLYFCYKIVLSNATFGGRGM